MAGYSKTPLAKKLGIKPGFHIKLVNAPEHYFDLFTDMPEDISEEEWDKRRETWDKIFERNSIPSNTGLSFPLIELENCWEFCYWYWDKENKQKEEDI